MNFNKQAEKTGSGVDVKDSRDNAVKKLTDDELSKVSGGTRNMIDVKKYSLLNNNFGDILDFDCGSGSGSSENNGGASLL